MTLYCWFNPIKGTFSDSWTVGDNNTAVSPEGTFQISESLHKSVVDDFLNDKFKEEANGYRLIKYEVIGEPLQFSRNMKLR